MTGKNNFVDFSCRLDAASNHPKQFKDLTGFEHLIS